MSQNLIVKLKLTLDWGLLITFLLNITAVYSVGIKAISNSTQASPGTQIRFTCLVSGLEDNLNLWAQIYKTRLLLDNPTGVRTVKPVGSDLWQIANDTVLNYALADSSCRYSVEDDTLYPGTIHVDIKDAMPEDSGYWQCRLIKRETDYIFLTSQELRIHVIGDVVDQALFLKGSDVNRKEFLLSGSEVTLHEYEKKNIECEFSVTNVMPIMDMYLGNSSNPYFVNVSDDFYYLEHTERSEPATGLISQFIFFHFKNRHKYPKISYHRQRFTCHTEIKSWRHYDAYVDILVKATPRGTTCSPELAIIPTGGSGTIICKTWSYPEATSWWQLPNGTVIYHERMKNFQTSYEYGNDYIVSTITITRMNETNYGKYSLTIENEVGKVIHYITVTNEAQSSPQLSTSKADSCHLSSVLLLLITILLMTMIR